MDRLSSAAMAVALSMTAAACATPERANVVANDRKSTRGSAEPTVLANLQLDSVTAAGVLVDVGSFAAALGDLAGTRADAETFVSRGEAFDLGVGRTVGLALACCNEKADVAVGSAAVGSGDIVHGTTHSVEHDGRFLDLGLSVGFVFALSVEKHVGTALDEHVAMLEQWRPALADRHLDLPGAVPRGAE
jgi:hypothetical protein